MNRVYYYAEVTGSTTTTSSGDQTRVTLQFTPEANSEYLYIWSAQVSSGSTSSDVRINLKSGATTLAAGNLENQDTTDWHPVSGIVRETFGASPSQVTLTLNYSAESSNTAGIREARILAIRLESEDVYAENTSDQTNTSTTFSTAVTLNWTPPSAGDYLLLGSSEYRFSSTSGEVITRFVHSSTNYGIATCRPKDTTNYYPGMHAVYLSNLSGAQTATVQWARSSTTTGTSYSRRATLAALRVDGFINIYEASNRARATTTSNSPQTRATTGSISAANQPHLIIGACVRDHNSTSNSARTVIAESASGIIAVTEQEAVVASTTIDVPMGLWGQALVVTPAQPTTSFDLNYYSESSGTSTGISDAQIVVLQLLQEAAGPAGYWSVNGVTQQ
jgi:hypothetical protein